MCELLPNWPAKRQDWVLVLALLGLLTGCTSPVRKLTRAQELQKAGDYAAAIRLYSAVLARVPDDQPRVTSQINLHIADCQWAIGEPRAALISLQTSLSADPENRTAHLRLSQLLLASGPRQGAMDEARWVIAREPSNLDALTVLANAYAAIGNLTEARIIFERVLNMDPGRVDASLPLAHIYDASGDELQARKVLRQAADAHASGAAPWLALARMEEEKGNIGAAEGNYRRALAASSSRETRLRLAQFLARASRISEAEQLLAEVDQKDLAAGSTSRADFNLFLGRGMEAVREYTSALQQSGSTSVSSVSTTPSHATAPLTRPPVVARVIEAELALAHKDAQNAGRIEHAKTLLARYRGELDSATSESLEAEIALVLGDLPQAEAHAHRALALAPESAAANFVAGLVQHAANDLPAANRYWDAALEKDPGFLPARQAVAARALASGDAAGAEAYVVPVVRQEPANFQALCIYARVLLLKGEFEAAKLIARRAMAANASSAEPHLILGDVGMQQGRLGSAFIEYQQAILLEPGSAEAMAGLARVYRKGKITRSMLLRMERIAANPPASASLMEVVGRLYAEHGWQKDAERALRRAATLDPNRPTAFTALALTYARDGNQSAAADSLARTGESAAELIAGTRALEENDTGSAIRNYEAAIRLGERSGAAANNLAWIYAQRGIELDRALDLAQLARRLAPHDPAVLDTIGFVQIKRREYSAAIETLKHAVELARDAKDKEIKASITREVKLHLAEAYLRSGQPEAAAALKNSLP